MLVAPGGTAVTGHHQYVTDGMDPSTLAPTPMAMFQTWFQEAMDAGVPEPEAMTLSTTALPDASAPAASTSQADKDKWSVNAPRPSSRTVLLKGIDERGFFFYSNYSSRKGDELAANPWCALSFYWPTMHRAIRVVGRAERVPKSVSQTYFDSRPIGSRIGAWASPQSQVIASRESLETLVAACEREFDSPTDKSHIPVPAHWGGYLVVPDEVEFWTGRMSRLHDRFRYTRDPNTEAPVSEADTWTVERLAP